MTAIERLCQIFLDAACQVSSSHLLTPCSWIRCHTCHTKSAGAADQVGLEQHHSQADERAPLQHSQPGRAASPSRGPHRRFGFLSSVLQLPSAAVSMTLQTIGSLLGLGAHLLQAVSSVLLPRAATRALQGALILYACSPASAPASQLCYGALL